MTTIIPIARVANDSTRAHLQLITHLLGMADDLLVSAITDDKAGSPNVLNEDQRRIVTDALGLTSRALNTLGHNLPLHSYITTTPETIVEHAQAINELVCRFGEAVARSEGAPRRMHAGLADACDDFDTAVQSALAVDAR